MQPPDDITTYPAVTLVKLIRERQISCLEVASAFLRKIDRINPGLNAFCTVLHDQAIEAARNADDAIAQGAPLGQLHGVPVALKDLTPTAGIRTTRGSRLFANFVPEDDAEIVKRIRRAGAIVIGKTNTPEFGHKGETNNLIFGQTRNPWNPERTPGGSSGGSAAAVAANLVPFAEGSDGAGSIRIPAAMCGIYGFKPSYGRIPDVAGPFSSHTPFFHNGPLARSVEDAVLLYQAMAGFDVSHPFSVPASGDVLPTLDSGVKGLRVAYSPDLGQFAVAACVRQVCRDAAKAFERAGCIVDEVAVDFGPDLEESFMILWRAKLATVYSELPDEQLALLEPVVQKLIEDGKAMTAVGYGKANLVRERVWSALTRIFSEYDFLICPTTAVPAFKSADGPPSRIDGIDVNSLIGWFLTYPFNLTGNPAASVPCGFSEDGLPIGLQIIGPRLSDDRVLRASRAFEKAAPWPSPQERKNTPDVV
ncbi:MAG: amidase [Bradyrhizobiaceae bacterium]|nr:MAG: amidase [Bradyrhizobiaceae bacterium]